jgi:hypothetical protein
LGGEQPKRRVHQANVDHARNNQERTDLEESAMKLTPNVLSAECQ